MARIAGRRLWLAVPIGALCAIVVGVLGWLALPMIPVSATWVGQMFHSATNMPRPVPAPESVVDVVAAGGDIDCRTLYTDPLWAELTWTPDVLLAQTYAPPATVVTTLNEALAPSVIVSCVWRADGGRSISSTLARVSADAAPVAEAALRGAGFDCAVDADADALRCSLGSGGVVEEHVLRGDIWLSSVETSWPINDYGARVEYRVWG